MEEGAESYRRFLEGDKEAFGGVLDAYREMLILFIYRMIGIMAQAEDIAEDCFVELIVHPHRFNFQKSLKTYLLAIARHKTVDYLRQVSKIKKVPLDDVPMLLSDGGSPEKELLADERKKSLYKALDQTRDDYRMTLYLLYIEDLSYEEAGRIMKKSRKQIENLAFRGRQAVRAILERGEVLL